jgi:hypothetical protein
MTDESRPSNFDKAREFFAAHIVMLCLAGVTPIILSNESWFPAPAQHPKLRTLVAIVCMLTALLVHSQKERIAVWSSSHGARQALPVMLAVLFGVTGSVFAAAFLTTADGPKTVSYYLVSWPLLTACAVILLTLLWSQHGRSTRSKSIMVRLTRYVGEGELLDRLSQVAAYIELAKESPALKAVGAIVEKRLIARLDDLHQARLHVDAVEVYSTLTTLSAHYSRFDGLSGCDLEEWKTKHALEYLELNQQMVLSGKKLTRIFLIRRSDLENPSLPEILQAHMVGGIGFGVALIDEMPLKFRDLWLQGKLHYGVWDYNRAYSEFEPARGASPAMTVVFGTKHGGEPDAALQDLSERSALYEQAMSYIWMWDKTFEDFHFAESAADNGKLLGNLRKALDRRRQEIARRTRQPQPWTFPLRVTEAHEIETRIGQIAKLSKAVEIIVPGTDHDLDAFRRAVADDEKPVWEREEREQ